MPKTPKSSTPFLPTPDLTMTPRRAAWFSWSAFGLGLGAVVANSLVGVGFLSSRSTQIAAWVASLCSGLAWYFARKTPSAGHLVTGAHRPKVP